MSTRGNQLSPVVPAVRRASLDEVGVLAGVVAEAFDDLEISHWLVPFALERARILPVHFRILVEHAVVHGLVHTVDDLSAVAVWLPVGEPVPGIVDYDQRLATACGVYTPRFQALDAAMHEWHPAGPDHEHLALLAVDPERQNAGLGGALLAHRHRDLDTQGRPAYLEASSHRSAELYRRHGYRPLGMPFAPGDCAATMRPMWRDPTPTPGGSRPRPPTNPEPASAAPHPPVDPPSGRRHQPHSPVRAV